MRRRQSRERPEPLTSVNCGVTMLMWMKLSLIDSQEGEERELKSPLAAVCALCVISG